MGHGRVHSLLLRRTMPLVPMKTTSAKFVPDIAKVVSAAIVQMRVR